MAQALRPPRYRGRLGAAEQHATRSDLLLHPRHFRGRHHAATIFVVLLLAVVGFQLFPEKDVTVLTNGQSYRVSTTFGPQSEALSAAGLDLAPGDRVLEGTGGRYLSLAVQRARPVTVAVDGATFAVRTQSSTVAGALADAGVDLHPGDRVTVDGQLAIPRGTLYSPSIAPRALPRLPSNAAAIPVRLAVLRARPVSVLVDSYRLTIDSTAQTVQDVLLELGMTVREGDLVHPGLTAPVTAGTTIRLDKGRTVALRLDGKDQTLYTLQRTVGDVVRIMGIELGPEDVVTPPLETVIANGTQVTIARTRVEEMAEDLPIAPGIVDQGDPSVAPGKVTLYEGTPGTLAVRWAVTYKNGVETARTEAGREVKVAAVPTRRVVGTKPSGPVSKPVLTVDTGAGAAGFTGVYARKLTVQTTWYTAAQGAWAADSPHYGTTKTGARVGYGVCAVDPSVIPLYTRMYIPGYGYCTALDTGGGVRGAFVDLGYPDGTTQSGWGSPIIEIFILD